MTALAQFRRIGHDQRGGVLVEFALLAPAFIAMLLGVFQIGNQMQNYNAVRSVASEVARYTVIQYQKENQVDNATIESVAVAQASNPPYNLVSERVSATATDVVASRITGAREITLTITYDTPSFLGMIEIDGMDISYSRPIFVAEPD